MAETMVRMAEMATSHSPGDVLVGLGLGSCIGLALVQRSGGPVGLAHVVLPQSRDDVVTDSTGKFADLAVPALVRRLTAAGASSSRLDAVLVGGAHMFAAAPTVGGLDIGRRNAEAVRAALAKQGVRVAVAVVGGTVGRTIRVYADTGVVTCRESGASERPVFGGNGARA